MANPKEKTPMCLLNELARYNKLVPLYELIDETGPAHEKTFMVRLTLGQQKYEANGTSIKKAQHKVGSLSKSNHIDTVLSIGPSCSVKLRNNTWPY